MLLSSTVGRDAAQFAWKSRPTQSRGRGRSCSRIRRSRARRRQMVMARSCGSRRTPVRSGSGYLGWTVNASATSGREKIVRLTPRAVDYLAAQRKAVRTIERQLRTELGSQNLRRPGSAARSGWEDMSSRASGNTYTRWTVQVYGPSRIDCSSRSSRRAVRRAPPPSRADVDGHVRLIGSARRRRRRPTDSGTAAIVGRTLVIEWKRDRSFRSDV